MNQVEGDEDENIEDSQSDDSEYDSVEELAGSLLVSGGKEGRICLWKT